MPEQTIALHIGRGKTGTTALRRHFAAHAGVLARHGIAYPGAAGAAEGKGHDTFGKAFIAERPAFMKPPRDADAALRALADQIRATPLPTILLLSEQLEMADPAAVRRYLDGIGGGFRYRVLFVLRSQDELVESEYNQLVRHDPSVGTLTDFAGTLFNGDFHATAAAWAGVFGDGSLTCAVYDAALPRVLEQVLDWLGAPGAPLPPLPGRNRSVSFEALTAIRMLNRLDLPDRRGLCRQILEAAAPAAALPALYFDAAEAAAFRARHAASNRALGRRFWGRDTPDLGGRRHDDAERDAIRRAIRALRLDRA